MKSSIYTIISNVIGYIMAPDNKLDGFDDFSQQQIELLESLPESTEDESHSLTRSDMIWIMRTISTAVRSAMKSIADQPHKCIHGFTPEQLSTLRISTSAFKAGTKVVIGILLTSLLLGSVGVLAIGASLLVDKENAKVKIISLITPTTQNDDGE